MDMMYVVLLAAAIALVVTHVLPSTPSVKSRIVAVIGESAFKGAYSLVAVTCIAVMIWAFNRVPQDFLWSPGAGLRHIPSLVMPLAFLLAVAGVLTRNPTGFGMEGQLQKETPATGIVRVTRHPFLWGTVLWSVAHILANGDVGSLLFFGGFFGLAVAGMIGIDHKRATTYGEQWRRFVDTTSSVPFLAILGGRNKLILGEIGWLKLLLAVAAYVALLMSHQWLFGVSPF